MSSKGKSKSKRKATKSKINDSSIIPSNLQSLIDIPRQLDQEKIHLLGKHNSNLTETNDFLRSATIQNERETREITIYYNRELEIKDEIIKKLNYELSQRDNIHNHEREDLIRKYNNEISFGIFDEFKCTSPSDTRRRLLLGISFSLLLLPSSTSSSSSSVKEILFDCAVDFVADF